jgi:hypothetical protein
LKREQIAQFQQGNLTKRTQPAASKPGAGPEPCEIDKTNPRGFGFQRL